MPEIKVFPETHVAYVSEVGPYGESIRRGFKRLFDWLEARRIEPIGPSFALFYDDPRKVAPENRRCDLCAPIGPDVTGDGEVRTKEVGGWRVATTIYQGQENAAQAYDQVYQWLRDQGYHEADAPIEKFHSRLGEELRAEIGVPIVEKRFLPGSQKIKSTEGKATRKATRKTATIKTATKKAKRAAAGK